jgi:hypothetical protein
MSQYNEGIASVIQTDATVTNTGASLWLAEVAAGDLFTVISSGVVYFVASVTSDTELELSAPYADVTGSFAYVIARDFTPINNIPIINKGDIETATLNKAGLAIIDGLL